MVGKGEIKTTHKSHGLYCEVELTLHKKETGLNNSISYDPSTQVMNHHIGSINFGIEIAQRAIKRESSFFRPYNVLITEFKTVVMDENPIAICWATMLAYWHALGYNAYEMNKWAELKNGELIIRV
ncbi:MAG: hypothetical protein ACPGLV_05800 [Bacteroidia bacterium]